MEDKGPNTRGKNKRARDSLELTKQSTNLYPTLDSGNESEDNYSGCDKGAYENVAQLVGVLRSQSEDSEPEYSDDESEVEIPEVDDEPEVEVDSSEEHTSFSDTKCFKIIIFLLLCLPFAVPLIKNTISCSIMLESMLEEELDGFPLLSLSKKLEIRRNIISKIDSSTSSDPLSIFLMFHEDQRSSVTSFANNIAHIFSKCGSEYLKSSESLSREYLLSHFGDLDTILDHKFETTTSAIVIQDFTDLSWNQAKLFLRYCDNENAPYKDRLFVFTSVVSDCVPMKPDKSAENALLKAWSQEEETIEALAVRVSAISVCFK